MQLIPADVHQALRRLAGTPLLSVGAMLTLALGIGSAVVMADVLDRLLIRAPAHVTDPDRVTRVYVGGTGRSYLDRTDYATFDALSNLSDELEASAIYFSESLSFGRGESSRRLETVAHSPGYFAVLGFQPLVGAWAEASNTPREDVAVISHGLWQREFGGSLDVLGKPLRLGLDTYSIVAVAPRGFAGIDFKAVDVWLPLVPRARAAYGTEWKTQAFFLQMIARLRPGVSPDRANERATAAYRATHTQKWEKTNVVVLGDLRPARAPGSSLGTRVETLVAGVSILVLLITLRQCRKPVTGSRAASRPRVRRQDGAWRQPRPASARGAARGRVALRGRGRRCASRRDDGRDSLATRVPLAHRRARVAA